MSSISLAILVRSLVARYHFALCPAPLFHFVYRPLLIAAAATSSSVAPLSFPPPPFLRSSHPTRESRPTPRLASPLLSSPLLSSPLLSSPLLSSPLRNIRTYSSGRPTDRSYARPTLAAMLLQEATVDGGGGSDCRHTTATDRCYRVAVAVAAAILFSCQRKCCSSEGKEEISALR